jgi:hypothetical protein
MRKLIGLFILTTVSLVVLAHTSHVQEKSKDNFEKMSFEVELNKNSYLPLEPIYAKFKFSNQTGAPLAIERPQFLVDSKLRVSFKDKLSEFNRLTLSTGRPQPMPGEIPVFQHGDVYERGYILNTGLEGFFPEPGSYQIQFVLYSPDGGTKSIVSNLIEITIENPRGIDKEAFEFLNKYKNETLFFGGEKGNGQFLLETFVNKYSESVYGEYAIYQLGLAYRYKNEIDKAQVEFEKIKSSKNKYIADIANESLEDVARTKAYLEKMKQQKQPQ